MSIETVRDALKSYRDFFDPGDEYCTCDPEVGYMCEGCARRKEATDALAALSTIDPEAIRRECADRAERWFYNSIASLESIELEGFLKPLRAKQIATLRAAILGAEPEKERKACNGCALRNKDNRPCADCERAAPCDPGLNDYYTPEPEKDGPALGDLVVWIYGGDWHVGIMDENRLRVFPENGVKPIVVLRAAEVKRRIEGGE